MRWIGKRLAQKLKIGVQLFEFDLHLAPESTAFFKRLYSVLCGSRVSVDSWKFGICRNAEFEVLEQCVGAVVRERWFGSLLLCVSLSLY